MLVVKSEQYHLQWAQQSASEALADPGVLLSYELCLHLNVPYGTRWGLPMEQRRNVLDAEGCAYLDGHIDGPGGRH